MLRLENIIKIYDSGDSKVNALNGISIDFRKNEFVSILGQSGCGKTTMLNIIGGLDHYTSGDLIIDGKSTKDFTDNDWDSYRNHSIGFVFQSYNLIPHQTVLKNVELALTLSGVSKAERKVRAIQALDEVGLKDQINKKPNQLSGGQMQRVAIARSLVNNPEILLADEPTGALDTETSIQVMEILKKVAKDRLVIMVTHNPELAKMYSTRIIKVLDGKVIDDSNSYTIENFEKRVVNKKEKKQKKVSMSFFTALALSLNNLFTKKARSIMVAFAGSIGIIGIALILSVSSGFQNYIDKVQEDTLSTYPITIEKSNIDMGSLLENITGNNKDSIEHQYDKIYSNDIMVDLYSSVLSQVYTNNMKNFKNNLETDENIKKYYTAVKYTYDIDINIYKQNSDGTDLKVNPSTIFQEVIGNEMLSQYALMGSSMNVWEELLDNQKLLDSQYEVLYGAWPKNYNEVVIVADENNEVSDYVLYSLGIKDPEELKEILKKVNAGEQYTPSQSDYTYEEICSNKYKLVLKSDMFEKQATGGAVIWKDISEEADKMNTIIQNSVDMKICGIIKPKKEAAVTSISGSVAYTHDLTEYIINETNKATIVKEQKDNPNIDIFTGMPFVSTRIDEEYINNYIASLEEPEKTQVSQMINAMGMQAAINYFNNMIDSSNTYDKNLITIGSVDITDPLTISIYPINFESKEEIENYIKAYNEKVTTEGNEANVIKYTDYIGILLSSVTSIVNAVTYVLIAFVAISLVVSSIMIGVITYISVLERIKEIGILRSIGASKKDISRVFNAETLIIGCTSGIIGVLITLLLCLPINLIIKSLANISNVAQLPTAAAFILVAISMLLTFIAGLIPSSIAAKKDPVEALRSE